MTRVFGMQMYLRSGIVVGMAFRTEENALPVRARLLLQEPAAWIEVTDDFGAMFMINVSEIVGIMIVDEAEASEVAIERGLIKARANARAQKLATTDPALNGGVVPARGMILPDGGFPPARGRG
jgi:hypothetical protein